MLERTACDDPGSREAEVDFGIVCALSESGDGAEEQDGRSVWHAKRVVATVKRQSGKRS